MRSLPAALFTVLFFTTAALSGGVLKVEEVAGRTRISIQVETVAGGTTVIPLRETDARVMIGESGTGPDRVAMFTTWKEEGRSWSSWSRDGGVTWAESRPLNTDVRLLDRSVLPGAPMPAAPDGYVLSGGRLFVVQFRTIGLPEWRKAIADQGAEVLNYLPNNAHIVNLDPAAISDIATLEFVERIEPYHPWYRLSPELRDWIQGTGEVDPELRVRVMAFEWGPDGKARIRKLAEEAGARIAEYWPSGHVLELWVDQDQLRKIASHDDVLWIDRWSPPGNDMDLIREDAGTNWLESNLGYCGQGVRGEVLDGGTQLDHPDFDGIMTHGTVDSGSHGTSTYGMVFGNGNRDGDGQAQGTGHMPCAEQGITADYSHLVDRFVHTQELKNPPFNASFQSNSWGASQTTRYTSDSFDLDDIIWRLDIAILNSQSNTGNQTSRPQAWAKNIISVGAVRHYDTLDTADDAWAGGGSIGPAADGRIKPDVSYWYDDTYTTTSGSGYTSSFGGTSGATPSSAGVLGLMLQMWSENVWDTDPVGATVFERQPHFSTLKALLINNGQQYDFTGSGHDLSRFKQGWGRPSVQVAHQRAVNSLIVDEEVILALNDSISYNVDVLAGETELKVTMVYPDPPGTTSSSLHRINDVNLKVTSPSATVYYGNVGLEDGTASVAGGAPDGLNTVENVFVVNPEPGVWLVEIQAVEINQDAYLDTPADDVTFALVVTGAAGRYTDGDASVRFLRDAYGCGQPLSLQVRDGNVGASSVTVNVWSETELTPETVVLDEMSPGSGKFTGGLPAGSGPPAGGDGILSISHGDVITMEYVDVDDGAGGSNVPRQVTAGSDCVAPVLTLVGESGVTDDGASVTWTSGENSTSLVRYGDTTPPALEASAPGLVSDHLVNLGGLNECTVYYYSVHSTDLVGNEGANDNSGAWFHFETLGDLGQGLQPCHEGRITIDSQVVSCSSGLQVTVGDQDLNLDPGLVETVSVPVTSTTEIDPEFVVLTETGPGTATFTGMIPTAAGLGVPADGVLQIADSDLLTTTYVDEDDGSGTSRTTFDTAIGDCAGPGHTWVAVSSITDVDATINWTTSEPTTGYVDWGLTPSLGNVVTSDTPLTSHTVPIGLFEECSRVYFRVVSTDTAGNSTTADANGEPFEFNAGTINGAVFKDGFESDAGWSLQGEWEIGAPQGLGSSPEDPASAKVGAQVLGHDLSGLGAWPGDYEPNTTESAVSPMIDTSALTNVELRFYRKLSVSTGARAYLEVTDAGGVWQEVYSTPQIGGYTESFWRDLVYDVSAYAAGNPNFQIRFRQQSLASFAHHSGWNLDNLSVRDGNAALYRSCGGCGGAPAFAGAISAVDDNPCGDSTVTVSWSQAPAWGTGGGGTYVVFRNTVPGFVPSAANRVASGVTGMSWIDPSPPAGAILYYLVRAESDETCGAGPNNGGLMDGNEVYVMAVNETSQPAPGNVGATLLVDSVNKAHARLSWLPVGGAAEYHVYRSSSPSGGFQLVGAPSGAFYEDAAAMGDAENWYYEVMAADACGNEENSLP